MKNVHDQCAVPGCTGKLLARGPLPSYRAPTDVWNMRMGGGAVGKPASTSTPLAYLACSVCGVHVDAAQAGLVSLENLRATDYVTVTEIVAEPECCPTCGQQAFAREFSRGPYGVVPERISPLDLDVFSPDPRQNTIGVYCTKCNTVIGTLPPDPQKILEHDRELERIAASIRVVKRPAVASPEDDDLDPTKGHLPH